MPLHGFENLNGQVRLLGLEVGHNGVIEETLIIDHLPGSGRAEQFPQQRVGRIGGYERSDVVGGKGEFGEVGSAESEEGEQKAATFVIGSDKSEYRGNERSIKEWDQWGEFRTECFLIHALR